MTEKKENYYLSDEELNSLIAEAESEKFIQAPNYLQDMILKKAAKSQPIVISTIVDIRKPDNMLIVPRTKQLLTKKAARTQLFVYGAKVLAGAAAAIALLIVLPTINDVQQVNQENYYMQENRETNEDVKDEKTALESINETTSDLCKKILEKTNEILEGGK